MSGHANFLSIKLAEDNLKEGLKRLRLLKKKFNQILMHRLTALGSYYSLFSIFFFIVIFSYQSLSILLYIYITLINKFLIFSKLVGIIITAEYNIRRSCKTIKYMQTVDV